MKFDWNSSIKKVTVENNDVGSERKLEFEGGKVVKQKLEKIDETKNLFLGELLKQVMTLCQLIVTQLKFL